MSVFMLFKEKSLIKKLISSKKIIIKGSDYTVKQHIVWYQHKAGYSYDKWVLIDGRGNDDYRLFINVKESVIGFARIFFHEFKEPMPKELRYKDNNYILTCDEFCTAIKVEGDEVYKKDSAEIWWDYISKTNKNEGLSLGRNWETWEREDLKTNFLSIEDIQIIG